MRTDRERPRRSFARRLTTSLIVCGLAAGAAGAHVRSVQQVGQLDEQPPSGIVPSGDLERILEQIRDVATPEALEAAPVDCAWSICDVAPAANADEPALLEARLPEPAQGTDSVRTGS